MLVRDLEELYCFFSLDTYSEFLGFEGQFLVHVDYSMDSLTCN